MKRVTHVQCSTVKCRVYHSFKVREFLVFLCFVTWPSANDIYEIAFATLVEMSKKALFIVYRMKNTDILKVDTNKTSVLMR